MAANYSANQYEKAYRPVRLQNWSPARPTKERVTALDGYTQFIADSRGHLLPSVSRSQVNLTARSAASAANLTKWIQENPDFLKACNGLRPEIAGQLRELEGRETMKQQGSSFKTSPQAPQPTVTRGSQDAGSVSPEVRSRHPSAGHTPGPPDSVHSPLPVCSPPNTPCSPSPAAAEPGTERPACSAASSQGRPGQGEGAPGE